MKLVALTPLTLLLGCSGKAALDGRAGSFDAARVEVPPAPIVADQPELEPFPIEIEIETDARVPLGLEIRISEHDPSALIETGDLRLLPEPLDFEFLEDAPPADLCEPPEGWSVVLEGERARLKATLRDEAFARARWVILTSEQPIAGCAPQARRLEPPRDSSTPRAARFSTQVRGGVRMRLVDEQGELQEDCFVLCAPLEPVDASEGLAEIWPLPAGPNTLSVVRARGERLEYREMRVNVADGRCTDLGVVWLDALAVTSRVRGLDENGEPLDFRVVAHERAGDEVLIAAATELETQCTEVELAGFGWNALRLVARPWSEDYGELELAAGDSMPRAIDLRFPRIRETTMNVSLALRAQPDETCSGAPYVFLRAAGETSWRAFESSYIGCTLRWYSLHGVPRGTVELLAWNPAFTSAALTDVVFEPQPDDERPWIEVAATHPTGRVRATLQPRVRGYPARARLRAWVQPRDVLDTARVAQRHAIECARAATGANSQSLEFAGIPAGIELELALLEGSRIVRRIPLRVEPGQTLELGEVVLDLE